MSMNPESTADREIVIVREFNAPRELVWEAMTDPKHVVNWWGPRGFSTTIETMDFRPGGVWKHVMRGPDGTRYPNKSIFKEIVRPERIVYSHAGGKEEGGGAHFVATWKFEALSPTKTRVTIQSVFPSQADRDFVIKEYGAIEGGKQTLMRLGEHLARSISKPFVITREFDAPRARVWKAWSERESLLRWFGPKGSKMTYAALDFRPAGTFHYCLAMPDGKEIWGRFIYREITPMDRILWVNSFSDKDAGISAHPFNPKWPKEMLSEAAFSGGDDKTTLTITWHPLDASEEERQVFDGMRDSMKQGWGGTLDQLAEHLKSA